MLTKFSEGNRIKSSVLLDERLVFVSSTKITKFSKFNRETFSESLLTFLPTHNSLKSTTLISPEMQLTLIKTDSFWWNFFQRSKLIFHLPLYLVLFAFLLYY